MVTPTPTPNASSDAMLTFLRIVVEEIKAAAHDPAMVHLAAAKLKDGIDRLEKALIVPDVDAKKEMPDGSSTKT
jgi:hypothetical protein